MQAASSQYLIATSIYDTNILYVYQIDQQTGSASQLSWSPLRTYNRPQSGTADPTGRFLYLDSSAGLNSTNTPYTIESFSLASLPASAPGQISVQAAGSSQNLLFDPQGKYFYTLDPFRQLNPPADGLTTTIQAYISSPGGVAQRTGAPTFAEVSYGSKYTYKANGNLVIFAHGSPDGTPYGSHDGITVYQEACTSGNVTFLAENSLPYEATFLSAPSQGDLVLGWNCAQEPPQTFMYKVDSSTGILTPYGSSAIQGICGASFDRQGEFAVGWGTHDPRYIQFFDTLVIYRTDPSVGLIETDRYTLPQLNGSPQVANAPIFDATGNFVYMPATGHLYAFSLNQSTGKLTVLPEVPQDPNEAYYWMYAIAQP